MITVVIPAYIKNKDTLNMSIRCINNVKNNTNTKYETVIVETESDYLKDYADIHIYEKNRTTATKSINRGFKVASGDYIVLLTNDCFVGDKWLECLQECFKRKEDCGLSTVATSQLGHIKQDKIEEGIWFSVAMLPNNGEYFDELYVNSWDDTDLIMRTYLKGKKMYRNYNCIAEHEPRQTHSQDPNHQINYERNREYFLDKYKDYKDTRIYQILTGGQIL